MKRTMLVAIALAFALGNGVQAAVPKKVEPQMAEAKGCLSCHEGIENIREDTSAMLAQIKAMGAMQGDPEGCVVCHGGNPQGLTAEDAHQGGGRLEAHAAQDAVVGVLFQVRVVGRLQPLGGELHPQPLFVEVGAVVGHLEAFCGDLFPRRFLF